MPNSGVSRKPSTLTVQLDDTLLAQLERQAAQYLISVDELVRRAIKERLAADAAKAPKNRVRVPPVMTKRHWMHFCPRVWILLPRRMWSRDWRVILKRFRPVCVLQVRQRC